MEEATWNIGEGRKLKALRALNGWSQLELAKRLGCDQATVSRIENGFPPSKPIRLLIDIVKGQAPNAPQEIV